MIRTPEQLDQDAGDVARAVVNWQDGKPILDGVTCDKDHLISTLTEAFVGLTHSLAAGDPDIRGLAISATGQLGR